MSAIQPYCAILGVGSTLVRRSVPAEEVLSLGRSSLSDLLLPDDSVSRRHALLRTGGGVVTLEDLGSRNATYVLGQRLVPAQPTALPLGAVAMIGATSLVVMPEDLTRRASSLVTPSAAPASRPDRVVADRMMQSLYALVEVIAPERENVIILGESGVGKEVYARAIHERSSVASGPFVALDCGLPGSAPAGALFGKALWEARGGTVFLDGIDELEAGAQAKLARALRAGSVGGARVVTAARRNVVVLERSGRLNPDLCRQLGRFVVAIPPLRCRRYDILALARLFARKTAEGLGAKPPALSDAAARLLEESPWHGNVTELRARVRRAIAFSGGRACLHASDFDAPSGITVRDEAWAEPEANARQGS